MVVVNPIVSKSLSFFLYFCNICLITVHTKKRVTDAADISFFLQDTLRPAKRYLLPICGIFPDIITPRRCCKNSNAEGDSYVQSKSYFTLCFSFLPSILPPTVLHLPQCGLPAYWNNSAENDCDDRRADKKDRPAHRPLFPPKP